jgi:head-tail adaptor
MKLAQRQPRPRLHLEASMSTMSWHAAVVAVEDGLREAVGSDAEAGKITFRRKLRENNSVSANKFLHISNRTKNESFA